MREILFKAIGLARKEWVQGVPVESTDGRLYMMHGAIDGAVNTGNSTDFIYSDVNHETVCQFTGELDSSKERIFEGDYVDAWVEAYQELEEEMEVESGEYNGGFVEYSGGMFFVSGDVGVLRIEEMQCVELTGRNVHDGGQDED